MKFKIGDKVTFPWFGKIEEGEVIGFDVHNFCHVKADNGRFYILAEHDMKHKSPFKIDYNDIPLGDHYDGEQLELPLGDWQKEEKAKESEDRTAIWRKEGRCPQCGELGEWRSLALVCKTHGVY